MALAPGTRLGPYEISVQIGAGGMGEVYRATDTSLKRDVAIKVLPEAVAADAERLARFQREAEVLASLNHPQIAAIYGLERSDGTTALVMELVEGPTLADLIARGPMALDDALPIARQIAEALEAAHEQGIVHRDLKPANIKIRPDGTAKVLDFGLAKAVEPAAGGMRGVALSHSPTLTSPAMITGVGMLLGTAAYMAPEQAKGRAADKRSDIWAFGCVLYEMLTARRAFDGDDVGETLAAVIRAQPEWAGVPAQVRTLLESCLEKDPRKRLRDIGDAWRLIEDHREAGAPVRRAATSSWAPWALAAIALVMSVGVAVWSLTRPVPELRAVQFTVGPSPADTFRYLFTGASVSPDGTSVVFSAYSGRDRANLLYVRPIDSLVARPLPGTTNADSPFWSPDSSAIAFFSDGKLKRLDLAGGTAFTLADAPGGAGGGTWSGQGVLLFAIRGGLYTVPAAGGPPSLIVEDVSSGQSRIQLFPQFLPDGDRFLYLSVANNDPKTTGLWVSSLSRPQDRRQLLTTPFKGVYAAGAGSDPDRLLFVRDTTLMAQAFDPGSMALLGEPVPVATDLTVANNNRWASFWAADARVLMFRSGGSARDRARLVWMARDGRVLAEAGPEQVYSSLRISPDGGRVAVGRRDPAGLDDQWVFDTARQTMSRFTFDAARETWPAWSPRGDQIAFSSNRSGTYQLYRKDASGLGTEQPITSGGPSKVLSDWSPDGRYLLYSEIDLNDSDDIWAWPLSGDPKPMLVVQTPFADTSGQFSPDGRWIAYQSAESGRLEVYVQAFPPSGGKWQVSTSGGRAPRWRADGRELFYVTPTEDSQALMAVDVGLTAGGVQLGTPHQLFSTSMPTGNSYSYDVTRDGQRFLMQQLLPQTAAPPLTVILNWTALLKK
ncbi:MAG: hypothetical protein FJW14_09450 [Acidimicrobiia bacterium]|nr:hypothetical protein [Acidimicrobiia bacterium]